MEQTSLEWAKRKSVSASKKARKLEEGIISESKTEFQKVGSDKEDSNFECYDKSACELVNADVGKKITGSSQKGPTFARLPNRSEAEEINNGETEAGNANRNRYTSLHRSNWSFKPPKRLASVPYFWTKIAYNLFTVPTQKELPRSKPWQMELEEIDSDYHAIEDK